jgi:hypothetical protein
MDEGVVVTDQDKTSAIHGCPRSIGSIDYHGNTASPSASTGTETSEAASGIRRSCRHWMVAVGQDGVAHAVVCVI